MAGANRNKAFADPGIGTTCIRRTMPAKRLPTPNPLGDFLKSVRAHVTPESLGIRPGARRRTPGLRREEVAAAADISATWYTWIEQGRDVSCSRDTLERIARALRMNETERTHLFTLARVDSPSRTTRPLTTEVASCVADIADALEPNPAYLINGRWDVLHFNRACAVALGAFDAASAEKSNVLARLFLDVEWRRFHEWEATAASAVAQYRAAIAHYADDERITSFIEWLATTSSEFRAMWSNVAVAPSPSKEKSFQHPTAGQLTFAYSTLRPDAAPDDVLMVVYMGQGATSANVAQLMRETHVRV